LQDVEKLSVALTWTLSLYTLVYDCDVRVETFRPMALVMETRPPINVVLWDPHEKAPVRLAIDYGTSKGGAPKSSKPRPVTRDSGGCGGGDDGSGDGGILVCPPEDDVFYAWELDSSSDEDPPARSGKGHGKGHGGSGGSGAGGSSGRPVGSGGASGSGDPIPPSSGDGGAGSAEPELPPAPRHVARPDDVAARKENQVVDPVSGKTFTMLKSKGKWIGHSRKCERCSFSKNLGWIASDLGGGGRAEAFARLLAWEAGCPGNKTAHRDMGGALLADFATIVGS